MGITCISWRSWESDSSGNGPTSLVGLGYGLGMAAKWWLAGSSGLVFDVFFLLRVVPCYRPFEDDDTDHDMVPRSILSSDSSLPQPSS